MSLTVMEQQLSPCYTVTWSLLLVAAQIKRTRRREAGYLSCSES